MVLFVAVSMPEHILKRVTPGVGHAMLGNMTTIKIRLLLVLRAPLEVFQRVQGQRAALLVHLDSLRCSQVLPALVLQAR